MTLIGLVGGTTWLSTIDYYRYINQEVARQRGGLHSARLVLHSVDFADVLARAANEGPEGEAAPLIDAAQSVERAGARLLALCANTAHVHAQAIQSATSIPMVHIAQALADRVRASGLRDVGLLSTARTRAAAIFGEAFAQQAQCRIILPSDADQTALDEAILDGARAGGFAPQHRRIAERLVAALEQQGAQGVILGCTELPLMLSGAQIDCVLFDSTLIHAQAIAAAALA